MRQFLRLGPGGDQLKTKETLHLHHGVTTTTYAQKTRFILLQIFQEALQDKLDKLESRRCQGRPTLKETKPSTFVKSSHSEITVVYHGRFDKTGELFRIAASGRP